MATKSVKSDCLKFIANMEKRAQSGIDAVAVEFADHLFDRLSEARGSVQAGEYEGSEPGQAPAEFLKWFTDNIGITTGENLESEVGFTHEHASMVYRMLVQGTQDIEPREGPGQLLSEIIPFLNHAFREGYCAPITGEQTGLGGF